MNCLLLTTTEQASAQDQVVVSLLSSESIFPSNGPGHRAISELELEAEMNRRAGVITDVLAQIIEHPPAPRYWGLNE